MAIVLALCGCMIPSGCIPNRDSHSKTALVTFQNYDDSYLWSTSVKIGKEVTYQGPLPTRPEDDRFSYYFSGWDGNLKKILEDTIFTAQYMTLDREFVVTFKNEDGTILDRQIATYGNEVRYQGELPKKDPDEIYTYTFSGWDQDLTCITRSFETTALFSAKKRIYQYIEVGTTTSGKIMNTIGETYQIPNAECIVLPVKEGEQYYIQGYSYDDGVDRNTYTAFFVWDRNKHYIENSSYSEQIKKENAVYQKNCKGMLYTIPKDGHTLIVLGNSVLSPAKIEKKVDINDDREIKGLFLGDSIIEGVGVLPKHDVSAVPSQDAVSVMERKLQCTILNGGLGAATFARPFRRTAYDANSIYSSFADIVDEFVSGTYATIYHHIDKNNALYPGEGFNSAAIQFDRIQEIDLHQLQYLGIAYGTNDWYGGITLDSNTYDEDTSTVLGALRYGIRKLKQYFPNITILVFTPGYREKIGQDRKENTDTYVQPQTNLTLEQFSNAIISCTETLQKELGNIYCKHMYQSLNQEKMSQYLIDGTHYNQKGYQMLGTLYADFILDLQEKGYLC